MQYNTGPQQFAPIDPHDARIISNKITRYDRHNRKLIHDRFWEKVIAPDANSCWEWTGSGRGNKGYGHIKFPDRSMWMSTHVSLFLIYGVEVPNQMMVCHHCDNPPCVNPSHLFIGTYLDNIHDFMAKGIKKKPKDSADIVASRKVSDADIETMKQLRALGVTLKDIAKRYEINHRYVCTLTRDKSKRMLFPHHAG